MPAYLIHHQRTDQVRTAETELAARIAVLWPKNQLDLNGTWVVLADRTSDQIRDALSDCVPPGDGLVVLAAGDDGAWKGISAQAGDWLIEHLTR